MEKKRLAMFDFDGTMIAGDSIADFVRFSFFRGKLSFARVLHVSLLTLLWKCGFAKVERVKSMALRHLGGMGEGGAEALCRAFVADRLVPRVYPQALARMREHAAAGDTVMLVSASPLVYLRFLKEFLPADAILGTVTDGAYRVLVNVVREEKPRQIRAWLSENGLEADWAASFAYGDSANDLPMLRLAGNPRLVNPKGKALRLGAGIPAENWK